MRQRRTAPGLPVMVTMTFEGMESLFGTDATAPTAVVLSSLGADAVGATVRSGPDQMAEVIHRMAEVTDIPIIAKPNAGLPALMKTGRQYTQAWMQERFWREMEIYEAGAGILGGCCGSTQSIFVR